MKPAPALDLARLAPLIEKPREFAAGWIEGRNRYSRRQAAEIPRSWFDPRTIGRAASDAAVAYYLALYEDEGPRHG